MDSGERSPSDDDGDDTADNDRYETTENDSDAANGSSESVSSDSESGPASSDDDRPPEPVNGGPRDESTDRSAGEGADPSVGEGADPSVGEGADPSVDGPGGSRRRSTAGDESFVYRFRHDQEGVLMWVREMLSSVAIVLVLGLVLFAVSGVWPPMVAVESGSMEPNMEVGDLVFVTEPGRFAPDAADNDIGVVTYEVGEERDYGTFDAYGSVIIFQPPDRIGSPIIHRAMFHVEADENWYDRADDRYHSADDCEALRHCPAPHDGYITLGDNNGDYDQVNGLAAPVKADWVTGVARLRVPYLGYVRLIATGQADFGDILFTAPPVDPAGIDSGTVSAADDPDRAVEEVTRAARYNGTETGGTAATTPPTTSGNPVRAG